jgi:hypothetical protein
MVSTRALVWSSTSSSSASDSSGCSWTGSSSLGSGALAFDFLGAFSFVTFVFVSADFATGFCFFEAIGDAVDASSAAKNRIIR